jgi:hypothetical protein
MNNINELGNERRIRLLGQYDQFNSYFNAKRFPTQPRISANITGTYGPFVKPVPDPAFFRGMFFGCLLSLCVWSLLLTAYAWLR